MSPLYPLLAAALVGSSGAQQVTCSGHLRCVDSAWCSDEGYLHRTGIGRSGLGYASGEYCLLASGAWGRCCQPPLADTGEVTCWAHQNCVKSGFCDAEGYYWADGTASGSNAYGYCRTSTGARGTCCSRRSLSSGETNCWDHESCVSAGNCDAWGYYQADGTGTSNWNDWLNGSWCSTPSGARGTCCDGFLFNADEVSCWAHQECNPGRGCPPGWVEAEGSHSTDSYSQYCLTSDQVRGTCCERVNYS